MAEREQSPSHTQAADPQPDKTDATQSDALKGATFDAAKEAQSVPPQTAIEHEHPADHPAESSNLPEQAQTETGHDNPFEEAYLQTESQKASGNEPQVRENGLSQTPGATAEGGSEAEQAQTDDAKPDTAKLNAVLDAILAKRADPQQIKADVEAVLFITSKALQVNEIAEIVESETEDVETALGELIQDYAFREGSGLEIDDTDGYILQVREDCARIVHKMMPLEMSAATLRTLSAIAIKAPIIQSDLIELRGSTAYDHIAELLGKKLVSKRRQGRSYVLNTTKAFDDYFKLKGNRKELETLVNRLKPENKQNSPDKQNSDSPEDAFEQVSA